MEQQEQPKTDRTAEQRAASRAQGTLSRGPVTPAGKAANSRNSLRHGLRAKTLALANEHPEILDSLIGNLTEDSQPETNTEHALILDMAYPEWRQYRTWISETAEINQHKIETLDESCVQLEESLRTAAAVESSLRHSRARNLDNRAEARCRRQYHRALTTRPAIQKTKKCTSEPEDLPAC